MTLAEEGHLEEAKDIFGRVKTAAADTLPDAAVNLAHCHTINKECLQAVKNYTQVSGQWCSGQWLVVVSGAVWWSVVSGWWSVVQGVYT